MLFPTIFWIVVFVVSLVALVKGSDWLISGANDIGVAAGLSPFVVGITIVSLGTSLPELLAGLSAVWQSAPEFVSANAIGSNVANIFLVVGGTAVIGQKMVVDKDLIDLDLPLLAVSTVLFLALAWDGSINLVESIILVAAYGFYILYILKHKDKKELARQAEMVAEEEIEKRPTVGLKEVAAVIGGAVALGLGATYLIDSVVKLSEFLGLATGVITITAVAIGTSLPELFVSVKATLRGESETALGNIFGSNIFNLLMVVGIPGLFATIPLEPQTYTIGLTALIAATFLFIISGISRQIHAWEGSFYLALYLVFIAKLFVLF